MQVILDTNFLVDMFRFKITLAHVEDLLNEPCEFFITQQNIRELKRLKSKEAKIALSVLESDDAGKTMLGKRIGVITTKSRTGYADDAIVSHVKKERKKGFVVATNDSSFRKRLKPLGIRTIFLRAKKFIEIS
jgi:rRNA-processing protein FCF1